MQLCSGAHLGRFENERSLGAAAAGGQQQREQRGLQLEGAVHPRESLGGQKPRIDRGMLKGLGIGRRPPPRPERRRGRAQSVPAGAKPNSRAIARVGIWRMALL